MKKVWEKQLSYTVCRKYVDFCTRWSYSKFIVEGLENVPQDGAVILAPNHTNTLMDALVVLCSSPTPVAFGARADTYSSPFVSKIMRWLKILPIHRSRDGLKNVTQNYEVFHEAVDCMNHGVPFCIFSEGSHRPKRSLQPIKKGVFRIALEAAQTLKKKVYVVPVGIELEDYFRLMKDVTVRYGTPIEVHKDDDAHALTNVLYEKISSLITFFPDDESYAENEAIYEASRRVGFARKCLYAFISVVTFPLFLLSAVLCFPMWACSSYIRIKLKDQAWANTVRYGCKLLLTPLMMILWGVLGFIYLPWYAALAVLIMTLFSSSAFYWFENLYLSVVK